MGQETAPFINSLNRSWPLSTDKIRFGAVHLRTIKGAILDTFPNVTGAVTLTHTQLNDAARQAAANVFTSVASTVNAPVKLSSSNPGLMFNKTTGATDEKMWRICPSLDELRMELVSDDGATIDYFFRANRNAMTMSLIEYIASTFRITGTLETTGSIQVGHASDTTLSRSRAGVLAMEGTEMGFLGMPIESHSADYTLVLSDAGKCMYHPSGAGAGDTYTVPANASVAYPVETILGFLNLATDDVEITITSDTMRQIGSGATGPFFLPQYCFAGAIKHSAASWMIGGVGLYT